MIPSFQIFHGKSELRCDFALCALLAEHPGLIDLFWPDAVSSGQAISEVRLNTSRPSLISEAGKKNRETDVEIVLNGPAGRWLLLIENKIDAPEQKLQAKDYIAFAKNQVEIGSFRKARTVLFAPRYYPEGAFGKFNGRVSYEAVIEAAKNTSASAAVCSQVFKKCVRDYAIASDASMTKFYRDYQSMLTEIAANLSLVPAKDRTADQTTFYFRADHLPSGYNLIHVSGSGGSTGWIKLEKYVSPPDIEIAQAWFDQTSHSVDIKFAPMRKSFLIRQELPVIDSRNTVESQKGALKSCIEVIQNFYDWTLTQHLPEF